MSFQTNHNLFITTTQSSSSNPQTPTKLEKVEPMISQNLLKTHLEKKEQLNKIIPPEFSIAPESEEDEMEYIKETLKNLLRAEEISIRNKNQMIESMKTYNNNKKIKNYLPNILTGSKLIEETLKREDHPTEEPINTINELNELEKFHQIDDIINSKNETKLKTFTNFFNILPCEILANQKPNQLKLKSPLLRKEINSEQLSFIIEDDFEENKNEKNRESPMNASIQRLISNNASSMIITFNSKKKLYKRQISLKMINMKLPILPSKAGWLKKKSKNPFKKWQKRYCRIEDKKFFYYKTEKDIHPLGCLDFDLISGELTETMKDKKIVQFNFRFAFLNKIFIFKNFEKKNNDLLYWVEAIKTHIKASQCFNKNLPLLKCPRFWRDIRLSEKQFKQKADTLDIILFQSANFLGKLQRSFTRSHYDHVAVILRYGDSEICFLEAEKNGVGICNWNTFMRNNWYNLYKSVCFRHLEIERNEDFYNKTEKFVNMVIGNAYNLNPFKLLRRTSDVYDEEPINLETRTFFCSELVACAYKFLNLLPKRKASTKYWPGSFSKEKKLGLFGKCRLCEQYLIDFSLII